MSRKEKQRLICKAVNYNSHARRMASCNHLYMGSLATCLLYSALGAAWPDTPLHLALKKASDAQLDAALEQCRNILKYAEPNFS